ncbi:hypothetical protein [Psychrobacillus phage Perkons]|nr:hypothetical protein [Psychrobacillus phage Perkons]
MATKAFKALTQKDKHTVGNITSSHKYIQDIPNGVLFTEDVDNFHLVELSYNAEGERVAKGLTDVKKEAFLVASVERRHLNEDIIEFYNAKDERGRIVIPTRGLRFDVSAFALNTGVTVIKAGLSAHYNVATKKYLIHDGTHEDFASASVKFEVASNEDNLEYTLGAPMIRLEIK